VAGHAAATEGTVTPLPTNTSTPTPPETHSAATDAPTVDLDGTDAAPKPEADETADIDDTRSDGVGPAKDDSEIDDHMITGGVRSWRRIRPQRLAVLVRLLMAVGLAALIGRLTGGCLGSHRTPQSSSVTPARPAAAYISSGYGAEHSTEPFGCPTANPSIRQGRSGATTASQRERRLMTAGVLQGGPSIG